MKKAELDGLDDDEANDALVKFHKVANLMYVEQIREEIYLAIGEDWEIQKLNQSQYLVSLRNQECVCTIEFCDCPNYLNMKIICRHIFALRRFLCEPLFEETLIPERFKTSHDIAASLSEKPLFFRKNENFPKVDKKQYDIIKKYNRRFLNFSFLPKDKFEIFEHKLSELEKFGNKLTKQFSTFDNEANQSSLSKEVFALPTPESAGINKRKHVAVIEKDESVFFVQKIFCSTKYWID